MTGGLEKDVDMIIDYDRFFQGPKVFTPAVYGWSKDDVEMNHRDNVVKYLHEHPDSCMAAVILASQFNERGNGPAAVKAILLASSIPDANKIDVLPATLKVFSDTRNKLGQPWTNVIIDCSPAFIAAVLANPIFHHVHDDTPISFYCIRAQPEPLWILGVYWDITPLTTCSEFKDTFLAALLADPSVVKMVLNDHSNVPGEYRSKFILDVALHFAAISTITVRHGRGSDSHTLTAYRILFPPISNDAATTRHLQRHIMSPGFTFDVAKRGQAKPWLGPNPQRPQPMACSECHGLDHYHEDCPILRSDAYQTLHGLADADSSVPTFLSSAPLPAANDWTPVSYRGRGRARGVRGGFARGGRGYRGDYRGGYGCGYMPYFH
ncbi:hypothetical protein DFH07DRAFT_767928 [Mycena maculata]|uniref:Uncharacterized protein n=1 Tax=Mycena maculata TaxID=230809 RepID=A0AAD7NRJ0_9AGAR|nr:hypothetical protein DFH07DRAFT_767928 [Mycena maculata]